jgi:hypothetical protein
MLQAAALVEQVGSPEHGPKSAALLTKSAGEVGLGTLSTEAGAAMVDEALVALDGTRKADGTTPVIPLVNLNGTSFTSLMDQLRNAGGAVRVAMDKLAEAAPHGRDYQTAPSGTLQRAEAEHRRRAAALKSVYDELVAMAIALDEATPSNYQKSARKVEQPEFGGWANRATERVALAFDEDPEKRKAVTDMTQRAVANGSTDGQFAGQLMSYARGIGMENLIGVDWKEIARAYFNDADPSTVGKAGTMSGVRKDYNGWTNYSTWNVALWFGEGEQEQIDEMADEVVRQEGDARMLADQIEGYVDEMKPEVSGMFSDLLTHALGEVNWDEIAEHYFEDAQSRANADQGGNEA